LKVYFPAEVIGGEEQADAATLGDAADLAWFVPDELPIAMAFDQAHQVLRDWAEHLKRE
jgi:hypothetical protein